MNKCALHTFQLPIYLTLSKRISLNLNWYRNAHYQALNKTKQAYCPIKLSMFKADKIRVNYTLVWNNNRRTDFMNWIAVADKYFLDWLVGMGCIPDDDVKHYDACTVACRVDTTVNESYIIAEVEIVE
jgi:hypothetical protein